MQNTNVFVQGFEEMQMKKIMKQDNQSGSLSAGATAVVFQVETGMQIS